MQLLYATFVNSSTVYAEYDFYCAEKGVCLCKELSNKIINAFCPGLYERPHFNLYVDERLTQIIIADPLHEEVCYSTKTHYPRVKVLCKNQ